MVVDPKRAKITPANCILLICDIQEKFGGMFRFDRIVENSTKLIKILKVLGVPIIIAEHKPASCGSTVSRIDISGMSYHVKNQYSMCTEEIMDEISEHANKCPDLFHVILIGLETHVCVENTAIDLRNNNFEVHIVADCCTSRLLDDRLLALQSMRDIGCRITTYESIVTKLLSNTCREKYKNRLRDLLAPSASTDLFPSVSHL